jgi:hypothetical protein
MLGFLELPVSRTKHYVVYGGPYVEKPAHMIGVKMAKEIPLADDNFEIDIPTQDYQTPPVDKFTEGLQQAVQQILAGRPVYAGCMGGKGRTGLFLSVLAKAFGIEDPVAYVRKYYYSHAVETREQKSFVENFKIPFGIRFSIWLAKALSFLNVGKTTLTDLSGE